MPTRTKTVDLSSKSVASRAVLRRLETDNVSEASVTTVVPGTALPSVAPSDFNAEVPARQDTPEGFAALGLIRMVDGGLAPPGEPP